MTAWPASRGIDYNGQPAPSLRVRVTDGRTGEPIPNARVRLTWTDTERDHLTDSDGQVTLRGLTAETWTIEVQAKGHAEKVHAIKLAGTGLSEIATEVEPGFELFGAIVDEQGAPVAEAGISAFPLDARGPQLEYVKTDSEGRYRFPAAQD